MNDSNPPKVERRFRLRMLLVFALLVLSGCGPSKEQQTVDTYSPGNAYEKRGDEVEAEADFAKAGELVGLEIKKVGDVTVARFKGEETTLNEKNVQIVRGHLLGLAERKGRKEFILDFSDVQFISEEAFGRLNTLNKELRQANARLRLCSFHSDIQEVFALTGLDRLYDFDVYEDVEEALKAADRTLQDVQMISAMSVDELSERWRKRSLEYVAAVNEHVRRGMQSGWDQAGQPPKDTRQPLAGRVIDAVREANKTGELADLREKFPPAHSPFIELVKENGQHLAPLAFLDDGRIVLGIGYKNGHVVVIEGTKVEKAAGVLTFGRSPNRKYFAVARTKSIDIHEGWGGEKVASLDWPKIGPLERVQQVEQLVPFPDGQRVVLATQDAILAVESQRTELLYPRSIEELQENVGSVGLNNPHAAISPDGSLISIGDRLTCMHIIFNDQYEVVGEICPLADVSPCCASFSRDGKLLALSSFMLYNGATLVAPTSRFPGLSVTHQDLEKHWFSKNTVAEMRKGLQELDRDLVLMDADARVYAAVWRGEEFIMRDAYGDLRAFDKTGKVLWQHFIGSSIGDIDLSPDGKTLVVSTYAGFVCILDLDTGEPDPFAISTATHRERRRWLLWKKEPKPLVW